MQTKLLVLCKLWKNLCYVLKKNTIISTHRLFLKKKNFFLFVIKSRQCEKCSKGCLFCKSLTKCFECESGYLLENGDCETVSKKKEY